MANSRQSVYVHVKPASNTSEVRQEEDSLKVYLKSPPIDGKANEELLYLLSRYFNVRRSDIRIKSGRYAKKKLIQIDRKVE
ncbi:MAG: DUF167 domain-containing protein [Deltaproteobacteria bacterium]|nr:DUF167 domain-containing protein [Deltaproteobacteria bacterium]MCL5276828.1 DUF167 domain-containing protein [Deltaproteobacteria bacterium]